MKKFMLLTAMTMMVLAAAVPALAQGAATDQYALDKSAIQGIITEIIKGPQTDSVAPAALSDSVILVEEDPSDWADPSGSPSVPTSDKGFFAVSVETVILDQRGGEQVPATFEDLEVGQLVEATYAGPVAESYPTQGTSESVMILEDATDPAKPGPTDPGTPTGPGIGNGGSNGSSGGMNVLPDTGGPSLALQGAGVLVVIANGLLTRRFVRRR